MSVAFTKKDQPVTFHFLVVALCPRHENGEGAFLKTGPRGEVLFDDERADLYVLPSPDHRMSALVAAGFGSGYLLFAVQLSFRSA